MRSDDPTRLRHELTVGQLGQSSSRQAAPLPLQHGPIARLQQGMGLISNLKGIRELLIGLSLIPGVGVEGCKILYIRVQDLGCTLRLQNRFDLMRWQPSGIRNHLHRGPSRCQPAHRGALVAPLHREANT